MMSWKRSTSARLGVSLAAMSAVALGGCGGGGLADKIKEAVGASAKVSTTTSSTSSGGSGGSGESGGSTGGTTGSGAGGGSTETGGGTQTGDAGSGTGGAGGSGTGGTSETGGGGTATAQQGNSLYAFFASLTSMSASQQSPSTGTQSDVTLANTTASVAQTTGPAVPATGALPWENQCSGDSCLTSPYEGWAQYTSETQSASGNQVKNITIDRRTVASTGPSGYPDGGEDPNTFLKSSYYGSQIQANVTGTQSGENFNPTGGNAWVGALFGGTATNTTEMSTLKSDSVTAAYSGRFQGTAAANDGSNIFTSNREPEGIQGDVRLNANFGADTINGNVYNIKREVVQNDAWSIQDATYGLALQNGQISGNQYKGSVAFTNAATQPGAAATSTPSLANWIGQFFGTDAAETAGAVQVEGNAPGAGQIAILGSYGAKKGTFDPGGASVTTEGTSSGNSGGGNTEGNTGGSGTGGNSVTASGPAAGYFVTIPNVTNISLSEQSPASGQTITLTDLGNGTHPETNGNVQRRSLTVDGSPVAVTASGTMHEWGGCGPSNNDSCATQQTREYYAMVGLPEKKLPNGSWQTLTSVPADGDTVRFRERQMNVRTENGFGNNLQHAFFGDYSDHSMEGTFMMVNGEPDVSVTAGTAHALGVFHGGSATSSGEMTNLKNSQVSASYQGQFVGRQATVGGSLIGNGDADRLFGGMSVFANFGNNTVSGTTTHLTSGNQSQLGYGVGFNGQITGSTYAGAGHFTNGGNATPTGGMGDAIGGFYGPNAAETAGSIRVQGTAPGTTGTTAIIGSFGAKKVTPAQ